MTESLSTELKAHHDFNLTKRQGALSGIEARVLYLERWDAEAEVFVAFIPIANQYTQASTKERLAEAVAALLDTLQPLLVERGRVE